MIEAVRIEDRPRSDAVERAAARAGLTALQSRVVAGRLRDHEAPRVDTLVRPRIERLSPPDALPDIERAADAVARAVVDALPILIISDFDCDGASGHCVLRLALQDHFGVPADRVHSYIGHRLRDGYGVSETLTDRILERAPSPALVITVDQGSTDHVRIARLKARGLRTVVTDHHGVPDEGPPPDALACVNPARTDSGFDDPYIAGVHVAWLLCCAVRQRLIELGHLPRSAPRLGALLDLVALGTMADCVDLARSVNNRAVLARGLQLMNRPDARPVWRALQAAGRGTGAITATTLGFHFGPVINARGRLDCALGSVDLLLCADESRAAAMAEVLVAHNAQRKQVQRQMLERAMPWAQEQVRRGASGIAVFDPEGHPGVHGICAARLVEATGRPVAYLSPRLDGSLLSGSMRTVPGFHVRDALRELAAQLGPAMSAWGGHQGAGGVSLRREAFERFADGWNRLAAERLAGKAPGPRVLTDGVLPVAPALERVRELAALEPFGREWEPPVFRAQARIERVQSVGDGTHLKLALRIDGEVHDAIWFNASRERQAPVAEGQAVAVAYELDANTYRDSTRLQLRVRHAAAVG